MCISQRTWRLEGLLRVLCDFVRGGMTPEIPYFVSLAALRHNSEGQNLRTAAGAETLALGGGAFTDEFRQFGAFGGVEIADVHILREFRLFVKFIQPVRAFRLKRHGRHREHSVAPYMTLNLKIDQS